MTIATATIQSIGGSQTINGVSGQMVVFTDGTKAFVPGPRPSYSSTFASLEPLITSTATSQPTTTTTATAPVYTTVTNYNPTTGATTTRQYQTTDKTRSDWVSEADLAFYQQQAADSLTIYQRNQTQAQAQADALAQQQAEYEALAQQQTADALARQQQEAAILQQQQQAQAEYEAQLAASAQQQAESLAAQQLANQALAQQQTADALARQQQEALVLEQQRQAQAEYEAQLAASAEQQQTALAAEQIVNAERAADQQLAYYQKVAETTPGAPQPVASAKDLGAVTNSSVPRIDVATGITYFPTADGWRQYQDTAAADYVPQNQLMMKLPEISDTSQPFTSPSGKVFYPLQKTYTQSQFDPDTKIPVQADSGWVQGSDPNSPNYVANASQVYSRNQIDFTNNQISYVDPSAYKTNPYSYDSRTGGMVKYQTVNPYAPGYIQPGVVEGIAEEIRLSNERAEAFKESGDDIFAQFDKLVNNTIGWKTIATIAGSAVGGPWGAAFANAAAGAVAGDSIEDIAKSAAITFALAYGTQALGEALNETVATGVDSGLVDPVDAGSFLDDIGQLSETSQYIDEAVAPDFGGELFGPPSELANFVPEAPIAPDFGGEIFAPEMSTTIPGTEYTGGQDLGGFYDTAPVAPETPTIDSITQSRGGKIYDYSDGSQYVETNSGDVLQIKGPGGVDAGRQYVDALPSDTLTSAVAPEIPVESYIPVSEGPQLPVQPTAPADLASTGVSDMPTGTTFEGPAGTEVVLDSGKTVNLADYNAAIESGQPVSVDGQMTTGGSVQVQLDVSPVEPPGGWSPQPIPEVPVEPVSVEYANYDPGTIEITGVGSTGEPIVSGPITDISGGTNVLTPEQLLAGGAVITGGAVAAGGGAGGGGATVPTTPTPTPVEPVPTTPTPTPVEPVPTTPTPVEPVPTQPTPTPTPVEPVPTTPTPTPVEPVPTTPTPTPTPTPVEPVPTQPPVVEPVPTTPTPVEPVPTTPTPVEPVPTTPTPVEPVPTQPPVVEPPVQPPPTEVPVYDYSTPYTGEYSNQSVLERFMSGTITYGDVAKLVAAGYVLPSVLALIGGAPPAAPGRRGYGPLAPIQWGTLEGGLTNPGLNPGFLTFGGSPPPAYQTTNPIQSQYYWGMQPYMRTQADLATYNQVPLPEPFGPQQPRGAWDYQKFIRETIGTPEYQQAAIGGSTQYPGGVAPATSYQGGVVAPAPAMPTAQFTAPVPTTQPINYNTQPFTPPVAPAVPQVNMQFTPVTVPTTLPEWAPGMYDINQPVAPYGTTPVPAKA